MLAKPTRFCQWAEIRFGPYRTRIPPELPLPASLHCEIASQPLDFWDGEPPLSSTSALRVSTLVGRSDEAVQSGIAGKFGKTPIPSTQDLFHLPLLPSPTAAVTGATQFQ